MSYKEEFEAWIKTRPAVIQLLAKKYPPGYYKIKEGSPYSITSSGSPVELISYLETGQVGVLIKGKNKSKEALEHEELLCKRYNKSKQEIEDLHQRDVKANVDPKWLELINSEI